MVEIYARSRLIAGVTSSFLLYDHVRESLVKPNVIQEVNSRKSHSITGLLSGNMA